MSNLIGSKIKQAIEILDELDLDMWLIFLRESDMMADPALELVVGHKVTWQSAIMYCRTGEAIAMIGNFDAADFERSGNFTQVIPYIEDCGKEIRKIIKKIDPGKIALNYSTDDTASDGITHGMYLLLCEYLKGTPYPDRFVSSEKLMSLVRGRKTPEEIELLREAAEMAHDIWLKALERIKPGMSEIEIGKLIDSSIARRGAVNSFETIVNAGAKTEAGHGQPTVAILEPGDLLHVDFGIRYKGYCSDIQRLAYLKKKTEKDPPQELKNAFNMVREIIEKTSRLYRPGAKGFTIDAVARRMLKEKGYPVYQHALGHQIGRSVHDGSAIVGPKWKRYGKTPEIPLEKNNVFTVELGINVDKIGYTGLEEDLVITENGGEFLCPVQEELYVV